MNPTKVSVDCGSAVSSLQCGPRQSRRMHFNAFELARKSHLMVTFFGYSMQRFLISAKGGGLCFASSGQVQTASRSRSLRLLVLAPPICGLLNVNDWRCHCRAVVGAWNRSGFICRWISHVPCTVYWSVTDGTPLKYLIATPCRASDNVIGRRRRSDSVTGC